MKETEVSVQNNILIISFGTDPANEEPKKVLNEIREQLKKMTLPWYCIADYTRIEGATTPTLLNTITKAMEIIGRHGVSEVIRVVERAQSMFQICLSKQSKTYGGYEGIAVETFTQAIEVMKDIQAEDRKTDWEK